MNFWSRIAAFALRKAGPDSVGSEIFSLWEDWGLTNAGVAVNSFSALQHVAVMACVSILSEDVAKLPVDVFRRLSNGGKEVATDHFLHRLLRRPNPWQTRFEFMEMMQSALVLRGNAYAAIVRNGRGTPVTLVPVHPDRVTLYEAPDGEYFYLVTRSGLHEMAVLSSLPIMIPSEDMLHVRWMASWNSLLGISRITMMRESVGLSISQEHMAARLAGTGARPGGVLMTDRKLSPEVAQRIKSDWQQKQAGWRNAGATAVLEEGLKWQPLTMTMEDAEFMENRRFQIEDIARGFRVPPHKIGLPAQGAASSMVQQDQQYLNDVIVGYCTRYALKVEDTFALDGEELFIEHDYEHVLKADIATRLAAKRTGVVGMIYTPNEARRGEGLPSVDGGDVLYQPTNVAPIGFTPAAGASQSGPGSDTTGAPGAGGDGDAGRLPGDDPAPSV
ncbi:MAG TPA: phage portal protein [Acetobacteraceae bacterium]|nr:phage portal protein [Acetobacteraceae bacterium]